MSVIRGVKHVLWICGRPWSVEFVAGPVTTGNRVVLGDSQEGTLEIRVASQDVSRVQQRTTLLHEWLHACIQTSNPPLKLDDEEECYVRALETTVYDSLRDSRNAWFRAFLLEPDELLSSGS